MHDLKYIIEDFLISFARSYENPQVILGHMAEDGEWWVAGSTSMSGRWSKPEMLQQLARLAEISRDGVHFKPVGWIVGDQKVSVEAEGRMSLLDGREYKNDYHFVFELEDREIVRIREYMDTGYVLGMFGSGGNDSTS